MFVIAVSSASTPHRSTLKAFNIQSVCTEECIQEVTVEDAEAMKVCDMVCQDRCLVVLTTTSTLHLFSIAPSCRHSRNA